MHLYCLKILDESVFILERAPEPVFDTAFAILKEDHENRVNFVLTHAHPVLLPTLMDTTRYWVRQRPGYALLDEENAKEVERAFGITVVELE